MQLNMREKRKYLLKEICIQNLDTVSSDFCVKVQNSLKRSETICKVIHSQNYNIFTKMLCIGQQLILEEKDTKLYNFIRVKYIFLTTCTEYIHISSYGNKWIPIKLPYGFNYKTDSTGVKLCIYEITSELERAFLFYSQIVLLQILSLCFQKHKMYFIQNLAFYASKMAETCQT